MTQEDDQDKAMGLVPWLVLFVAGGGYVLWQLVSRLILWVPV